MTRDEMIEKFYIDEYLQLPQAIYIDKANQETVQTNLSDLSLSFYDFSFDEIIRNAIKDYDSMLDDEEDKAIDECDDEDENAIDEWVYDYFRQQNFNKITT